MKSSYIRKLFQKYIVDSLPGFSLKGHLIYNSNYERILRGFCFEDSAYRKDSINIYVFVQPLYIPAEYLWFNFGKRLNDISEKGGDRWWNISLENEGDIMREVLDLILGPGLTFIENVKSLQDLVEVFQVQGDKNRDLNILEALAYTEILVGNYQNANCSLEKLLLTLEMDIKKYPQVRWLYTMKERVSRINKFILENESNAAYQQLLSWEKYTEEALKLK